MIKVLIAEDETHQRTILVEHLISEGFQVEQAENGEVALNILKEKSEEFQLVITDLSMPKLNGLELIENGKKIDPDQYFIIITAHGSTESAIKAMRLGAFDYMLKPIELDEVTIKVKKLFEHRNLQKKATHLEKQNLILRGASVPIGRSPCVKDLLSQINEVASTNSSVLLRGGTGVGKEIFANHIHALSPRSKNSFVAINCSAIPENLVESELFGHEKGAFTGADTKKIGLIEEANGGSLFLDEIGEMSLKIQPKLLRFLEDRKIRRVGGNKDIEVDVRLIAATHQDLKKFVQEKKFREDLYYRLNVVDLIIPPLRQRREDIPDLVNHFVKKYSVQLNKVVTSVDSSYIEALNSLSFAGNVRELANIVERSIIFMKLGNLNSSSLESGSSNPVSVQSGVCVTLGEKNLNDMLNEYEKEIIKKAMDMNKENIEEVIQTLGVSKSSLYSKMAKYGIKT